MDRSTPRAIVLRCYGENMQRPLLMTNLPTVPFLFLADCKYNWDRRQRITIWPLDLLLLLNRKIEMVKSFYRLPTFGFCSWGRRWMRWKRRPNRRFQLETWSCRERLREGLDGTSRRNRSALRSRIRDHWLRSPSIGRTLQLWRHKRSTYGWNDGAAMSQVPYRKKRLFRSCPPPAHPVEVLIRARFRGLALRALKCDPLGQRRRCL